jgi:hypothetical protein
MDEVHEPSDSDGSEYKTCFRYEPVEGATKNVKRVK